MLLAVAVIGITLLYQWYRRKKRKSEKEAQSKNEWPGGKHAPPSARLGAAHAGRAEYAACTQYAQHARMYGCSNNHGGPGGPVGGRAGGDSDDDDDAFGSRIGMARDGVGSGRPKYSYGDGDNDDYDYE